MPYYSSTTEHAWTVEVVRRTANTVWFRVVKGPAATKKKLHHMSCAAFNQHYRER